MIFIKIKGFVNQLFIQFVKCYKKIFNNFNLYLFKLIKYYFLKKEKISMYSNNIFIFKNNLLLIFLIGQLICLFLSLDLSTAYCMDDSLYLGLSEKKLTKIAYEQIEILRNESHRLQNQRILYEKKNVFFKNASDFLERLKLNHLNIDFIVRHNYFIKILDICSDNTTFYSRITKDQIKFQKQDVEKLIQTEKPFIGEIPSLKMESFSETINFDNIKECEKWVLNPPLNLKENYPLLLEKENCLLIFLNSPEIKKKLREIMLEENHEKIDELLKNYNFSFKNEDLSSDSSSEEGSSSGSEFDFNMSEDSYLSDNSRSSSESSEIMNEFFNSSLF